MTERPEVLLSRADYIEDIKVRWQIHTYEVKKLQDDISLCLLYTSPSPRDYAASRMPSSA